MTNDTFTDHEAQGYEVQALRRYRAGTMGKQQMEAAMNDMSLKALLEGTRKDARREALKEALAEAENSLALWEVVDSIRSLIAQEPTA